MSAAAILAGALLLDAALGEPRWLWDRVMHPAVLMGRAVELADSRLNTGDNRTLRGGVAMAALGVVAVFLGAVLSVGGWPVEMILAAVLISQRSLVDHVRAVAQALRISVGDARIAVSRIVGRDTAEMDAPSIARAAIESAAENLSDGVIAPAFWFLVGGLPGLLLYKITNTADSMIGYRTDRHRDFGWAAARFDDLLNLIPARLTAVLVAAVHGRWRDLPAIAEDARLHRSPNAGWPEAAMARALGVALSGPRAYDGRLRDYPFVNETGEKRIGANSVDAACKALWRGWGAALGLVVLGGVLFA
ncbi:adenosylcobinamide-phosphate synthase [Roseovarius sp. TE539]|uniref:adenosylcobinamide-phosphate synthase CbiB n=1 Tax=Roseovarius sp. TE539 TaxID=2249812 RepID=UPI000DE0DDB6|nr:adenosylcobinamide-phosphate synthase CbiB [Roseovarius sp. TE539]RBI71914.1 adenosylcobinamide-phosphate synthase [Roseovarius sp. TE539]